MASFGCLSSPYNSSNCNLRLGYATCPQPLVALLTYNAGQHRQAFHLWQHSYQRLQHIVMSFLLGTSMQGWALAHNPGCQASGLISQRSCRMLTPLSMPMAANYCSCVRKLPGCFALAGLRWMFQHSPASRLAATLSLLALTMSLWMLSFSMPFSPVPLDLLGQSLITFHCSYTSSLPLVPPQQLSRFPHLCFLLGGGIQPCVTLMRVPCSHNHVSP